MKFPIYQKYICPDKDHLVLSRHRFVILTNREVFQRELQALEERKARKAAEKARKEAAALAAQEPEIRIERGVIRERIMAAWKEKIDERLFTYHCEEELYHIEHPEKRRKP